MRSNLLSLVFLHGLLQKFSIANAKECPQLGANIYKSFGTPGTNATYDYVIIGGGTAGNAISARLAENSNYSVAIIEAGGFYEIEGPGSVIPAYAPVNTLNPLTNWNIYTQPMPSANNRTLHYTRGKTLGGSSALNYMVYQRGTKGSFDLWADQVDDQSYKFENVVPYFKKTTTYYEPNEEFRHDNSTTTQDPSVFDNGPVPVGLTNWAAPMGSWSLESMNKIGIATIDGLNSGALLGASWSICSIDPKYQHRASSQATYLNQAIEKTTIKVYTHSLAKQILFDDNKVATGVKVQAGYKTFYINAKKEIILSGGAFHSPQLLMVSGIGPQETLASLNIRIVSDLAGVGQNMWDHALWNVVYVVSVDTFTKLFTQPESQFTQDAILQYNTNASGPLTSLAGVLGWEKLPNPLRDDLSESTLQALAEYPSDWPELEYLFQSGYGGANPIDPNLNYASLGISTVAPISRGYVTINSSDTTDLPIVQVGYFDSPEDMELAIAGLKRAREAWTHINVTIGEEFAPGPDVQTDEQIAEYIRETVSPVFHVSCTCKMGKKDDPMAVVDSKARVFGVQGLRVVDASAFALLPPGHPQSAVYMLAEKIADVIRQEW